MTSPVRTASSDAPISLLSSSLQAALAGGLGGAVAALLLLSLDGLQGWIWGETVSQGLASRRSLAWCLSVPTAIGLALTLLVWRRPQALLPELADTLSTLQQPEPGNTGTAVRSFLGGVLALLAGASLGPEALVTDGVVRVSRLIWRGQDRRVSAAALSGSLALFHTPLVGPSVLVGQRGQLLWRWLPGTLAALSGFLCFQGLHALGGGLEAVPYAPPIQADHAPAALLSALMGGVVGSGCGFTLIGWRRWLHNRLASRRPGWAPLFTGVLLGLALWALPLAPFSGEHQLSPLLLGSWHLPPGLMILSGATKLLLVGLCLETGWRGGQIFPVILGGSAIGVGLHALLPQLGTAASWSGSVVGGSLALMMPSPLVALVLGLTLLRGHGAIALLVGLLVGVLICRIGRRLQGEASANGSSRP
jgi:H+/Cl- antiporter ClcA